MRVQEVYIKMSVESIKGYIHSPSCNLPDLWFASNIPTAFNNKTAAKYWENGLENGKEDKLRNIWVEDYYFCMPICQLNHENCTQIDFAAGNPIEKITNRSIGYIKREGPGEEARNMFWSSWNRKENESHNCIHPH